MIVFYAEGGSFIYEVEKDHFFLEKKKFFCTEKLKKKGNIQMLMVIWFDKNLRSRF